MTHHAYRDDAFHAWGDAVGLNAEAQEREAQEQREAPEKRQRRLMQQLQDLQAQLEKIGAEEVEIRMGGVLGLTPVIKSFKVRSKEAIKSVAQANPGNIQEVAASQLEISNNYYHSVLAQARQSFKAALIAGSIGLAFFLAAIGFVLTKSQLNAAIITEVRGSW